MADIIIIKEYKRKVRIDKYKKLRLLFFVLILVFVLIVSPSLSNKENYIPVKGLQQEGNS